MEGIRPKNTTFLTPLGGFLQIIFDLLLGTCRGRSSDPGGKTCCPDMVFYVFGARCTCRARGVVPSWGTNSALRVYQSKGVLRLKLTKIEVFAKTAQNGSDLPPGAFRGVNPTLWGPNPPRAGASPVQNALGLDFKRAISR